MVLLQEPGSEFQYQTSDAGHRTTDSGHQTSEIGHRTLDIRHQASDITHRISNIGNWTSEIRIHPISFLKKKKLGLLACYSFGFNFGPGTFLGFVGTFMGFYFPPFDCHPRQFSSGVSPWGVKAIRVQKVRVYS